LEITMGKTVSFFRHPEADPGETYGFEATAPGAKIEILVYACQPLADAVVADLRPRDFPTEREFSALKQRLQEAIDTVGGGALVLSSRDAQGATLEVISIPGAGHEPGRRCLALAPGFPPRFLDLNKSKGFKVGLGSHHLIPIDGRADEQLVAFVGYLHGFGPDTESLMLDALSRPTLESRVAALEGQDGGVRTHARGSSRFDHLFARLPPWLRRPLPRGPLVLLGVLLLILGAWLAVRAVTTTVAAEIASLRGVLTTAPPLPGPRPADEALPVAATPDGAPPKIELPEATQRLLATLAAYPVDSPEAELAASHFRDLGPAPLSKPDFAWGLVKLLALERGEDVSAEVLRNPAARSATKQLLQRLARELQPDARWLLGHVTCAAFEENRQLNFAGLPTWAGDTVAGRVDLPVACDDAALRGDIAARGLAALATRLDARRPAPEPAPEPPPEGS
jgi:hypothetical protein